MRCLNVFNLQRLGGGWRFATEIAELRRKDIDVRRECQSAPRVTYERRLHDRHPGWRASGCPHPAHLIATVPAHGAHIDTSPDGLLFRLSEEATCTTHLREAHDNARKEVGRPDRFHDLRHTGAVMARAGHPAELQARLGHSTATAAMRYQHASSDRDAEIARRLSAMAVSSSTRWPKHSMPMTVSCITDDADWTTKWRSAVTTLRTTLRRTT